MSNLLFGSSNIYRHFERCKQQGLQSRFGRQYEVIPCTKRPVLDSTLPGVTGASLIVTSVLANFICDACVLSPPEKLLETANAELSCHVQTLVRFASSQTLTRIVVVPPLPRSYPEWFIPYLPVFTTFLVNEISRAGSTQIRYLAPFVAPPSFFESDGLHLNNDAGYRFLEYIINGVDDVFPVLDCTQSPVSLRPSGTAVPLTVPFATASDAPAVPSHSQDPAGTASTSLALEFGRISSALSHLTALTGSLRAETTLRREQDNLVFARLKEDRDFEFNKNRENRVTIMGLISKDPPPTDPIPRKDFYKNILTTLVAEACPDCEPLPTITDVFVNMRSGRGAPFLEAKMDSVASATTFRTAASQLSRQGSANFADLFIANAVTLATRVRIEILRAIAKTITSDSAEGFVQGFVSRPLLIFKMRDAATRVIDGANRSYTFVEAVGKWGSRLSTVSLLPAYRRARPAFNGCLEQYFVVLKEQDGFEGPNPASAGSYGRGRGSRGGRGGRGVRGSRYGWAEGRSQPQGRPRWASDVTRKRTHSAEAPEPSKRRGETENPEITENFEEDG